MNITTATPAEIDNEIARLRSESSGEMRMIQAAETNLERLAKMSSSYRRDFYTGPDEDTLRAAITRANARLDKIGKDLEPLHGEFERRGGWTRWYLVDGGHLHYDVSDYRCNRQSSTDHYWMTEFSGQDAAEVIAQAGERVCTVCFPDAPVAPRPAAARFMTRTEAERAAYAEDKARKAAAKKAAELRDADGQPLVADDGMFKSTLKTDRAAWNWLMREAESLGLYGEQDDTVVVRESAGRVLAALAKARGVEVETLRVDLNTKTAKKAKRDGWIVLATF